MGPKNAVIAAIVIVIGAGPAFLNLATSVRPHPISFSPLRPLDPTALTLQNVERFFEDDPNFKVYSV